jgi:hypothetical protein
MANSSPAYFSPNGFGDALRCWLLLWSRDRLFATNPFNPLCSCTVRRENCYLFARPVSFMVILACDVLT